MNLFNGSSPEDQGRYEKDRAMRLLGDLKHLVEQIEYEKPVNLNKVTGSCGLEKGEYSFTWPTLLVDDIRNTRAEIEMLPQATLDLLDAGDQDEFSKMLTKIDGYLASHDKTTEGRIKTALKIKSPKPLGDESTKLLERFQAENPDIDPNENSDAIDVLFDSIIAEEEND